MTALALAALLALQEERDAFDGIRSLEEADLSWSWGPFEFELGGELDLEAYVYGDEAPGVLVEDAPLRSDHYRRPGQADSPEAGGRLRLTLDGGVGERLSWFVEGRIDTGAPTLDGEAVGARIEQAWVRVEVLGESLLAVQAGKFAAPLGNFIPRHRPSQNPLVTAPLPYDHVTSFMRLADTAGVVLGRKDRPDVKDWRVPVWREVYGTGGMLSGQAGPLNWAAALMNSAPGTWPFDWGPHPGDFQSPNVYLRASCALESSTTLGASWSKGPYHRDDADGVPAGREAGEFPQTLAGLDAQWSRGNLDVFAELIWTRFEAPLVDDLDLWSWYVEAKVTFSPGLFGALRVAQMGFGEIEDAAGESRQWDRNTARFEFGGGYFITRNLFVKATMQFNRQSGGREPKDDLLAFQMGLTF